MEEQPRRSISRRDFCGWVLKGVGAATVGVVLEACGVRPSPKPPTQQPEQSAKQNPEPFYVGNHKIIFNSDGLPVECILEDGSKVVFDLNKVGMIKEKAKSSQEPELLELIPTSEPKRHPATEGLLEHPRIFEKPEDIFCEEELERIGIEVIQTDQVKLFIRKWAIEKGSPLEDFNNTGRKLVIVLVDKPHVLKTYLKDPKYDKVREFLTDSLIEESPETLRNQLLHYYNEYLTNARRRFKPSDYEGEILLAKQRIKMIKEEIYTDGDIMANFSSIYVTLPYYGKYHYDEKANTVTVFVAVGARKGPKKYIQTYFDAFGRFHGQVLEDDVLMDHLPKPEQTHPNPAGYDKIKDPSPGWIFVDGKNPGWFLRHELAHDKYPVSGICQEQADQKALVDLGEAWRYWKTSGYKNDERYCFVFSVPEEEGGGYILTRRQNSTNRVST